ncbi:MAG TPA: NAD(+)/NADH kinase [Chloroflexota bacterium]|nr:NAD(+)/NADH kinase [Chloroflexota bacterium]
MLRSAAILYHPTRERALREAEWLAGVLRGHGVEVTSASAWDAEAVIQSCNFELAVVLGGDGSIIHVARLLAPCETPLIGVNLGRVGFLAELTPDRLRECIADLVHGSYWIEERTMLDVEWRFDNTAQRFLALNEVVVGRGLVPRAVQVETTLDGDTFITYTADAVLAATATGSTAYSLAAGGPILHPESREILLTPVAPHLHIGRSIVVPGTSEIVLTVAGDRPAIMSVDGTDEHPMEPGQSVQACRSDTVARFARMGPRTYFYQAIAARLQ